MKSNRNKYMREYQQRPTVRAKRLSKYRLKHPNAKYNKRHRHHQSGDFILTPEKKAERREVKRLYNQIRYHRINLTARYNNYPRNRKVYKFRGKRGNNNGKSWK